MSIDWSLITNSKLPDKYCLLKSEQIHKLHKISTLQCTVEDLDEMKKMADLELTIAKNWKSILEDKG